MRNDLLTNDNKPLRFYTFVEKIGQRHMVTRTERLQLTTNPVHFNHQSSRSKGSSNKFY
jgi:hypothetical protein